MQHLFLPMRLYNRSINQKQCIMRLMAFLFASVALLSLGACTEKSAQTVLHQIGSGGKSIKASGNYVTKSYSVGKFSTIEASGVATVVYTQTSGP